jgi:N-acetylmuramoyl-L-alanine amidase
MKKNLSIIFILLFSVLSSTYAQTSIPDNMVSLSNIAIQTSSTLYWDGMSDCGILEKNGHTICFSAYSDFVLLDYNKITFCKTITNNNGTMYAEISFLATINELFNAIPPENKFRIGAILIDPGHGGKDPGAIATHIINGKKVTINEKDLTLLVGKNLNEMLSKIYPNKKIMLTRDSDEFLSLSQRTDKANTVKLEKNEAILFVSIHANSAFDPTANGYEVWYLSPGYRREVLKDPNADEELQPILNSMMEEEFTTESILIAKYINDGLNNQIGSISPSRGIKEEEWFVCKNAKMPSVLVEMGFVSNKIEATNLLDDGYLRKISLGIYNGLTSFVTHFETSRGFTGTP